MIFDKCIHSVHEGVCERSPVLALTGRRAGAGLGSPNVFSCGDAPGGFWGGGGGEGRFAKERRVTPGEDRSKWRCRLSKAAK